MNDIDARAVSTYGGYHGEFRLVSRAKWIRLKHGGADRIFDTADEAEVQAWRAAKVHNFGLIRSTDLPEAVGGRAQAERMFNSIFRKGRRIPVETR